MQLKEYFKKIDWWGEYGARGFAIIGLCMVMGALYWYEHHRPSDEPPLPTQAFHYPIAKTMPLAKPMPIKIERVFTLQLMGSFKQAVVAKQLLTIKAPGARIFQEQYQGKPWYVLGLGAYQTRDAAKHALAQLPKNYRAQGAWVRPVHVKTVTHAGLVDMPSSHILN